MIAGRGENLFSFLPIVNGLCPISPSFSVKESVDIDVF